eukprot:6744381-Pyramimonas_sp.AAC.2
MSIIVISQLSVTILAISQRTTIVWLHRARGRDHLIRPLMLMKDEEARSQENVDSIILIVYRFTLIGLMNARTEDKRRKYEDTLKGLRED